MFALNLGEYNETTGGHPILSATDAKYAQSDQPQVEALPDGDITLYDYIWSIDEETGESTGECALNAERVAAREAEANALQEPTLADRNRADIDYLAMIGGVEL